MQRYWQKAANDSNIELYSFSSIEEFLEHKFKFDKNIPIYIDSNLNDQLKGEIESEKLFKVGFSNLFIQTASLAKDIVRPPWIQKVLRKEPPWISFY